MVSELVRLGAFDEIWVMPSKVPPHKTGSVANEADRLYMCKLSFGCIDGVKVSDLELTMEGKSYTLLTLEKLKGMGIINPTFVIGADSLIEFEKWYRFEEILGLCELLVYKRAGESEEKINSAKEKLEALGGRVTLMDLCPPKVSSSDIRNLCYNGQSIDSLVSKEVANFIKEKNLYTAKQYLEPKLTEECILYREEYDEFVRLLKTLLTEKRFYHTLCVAKEAVRLAKRYGANTKKAFFAGLLHDVCKDMAGDTQLKLFEEFGVTLDELVKNAPKLWHSLLGAEYIEKKLGVTDIDIISAVRYHTTARANMSLLQKIIYLADFTSEERSYNGVEEMREAVDISLEKAMHIALEYSVSELEGAGKPVHPDTLAAFQEAKEKYL